MKGILSFSIFLSIMTALFEVYRQSASDTTLFSKVITFFIEKLSIENTAYHSSAFSTVVQMASFGASEVLLSPSDVVSASGALDSFTPLAVFAQT